MRPRQLKSNLIVPSFAFVVRLSASLSNYRSRLKPEPKLLMIRIAIFISLTPRMLLIDLLCISYSRVGTI